MATANQIPTDSNPAPTLNRVWVFASRTADSFQPYALGGSYEESYHYWRDVESFVRDCIADPTKLEANELRFRSAFGDAAFKNAMTDRKRAQAAVR